MIIINLTGGLGNQMYQYAFGLYLAQKHKTSLKYHYTNALFNTQRSFGMDIFSISGTEATRKDLRRLGVITNRTLNRILYLLDDRYSIQLNSHIHTQRYPYAYDEKLRSLPNDSYVQGYFADKRYFKGAENIIKREYTLKNELDKRNKDLIELMKDVDSVSIHVRRGDYITNKNNPQFLGINYYKNKINEIERKVKKPYYFIFSDDIEWCRDNFGFLENKRFVDHNLGKNSYKDMVLISNCKYNILANSTFSQWGDWLHSYLNETNSNH